MQASLKKSLYLGLAALGFVAVAGATNATTANAAAAKEVSKTTIEHMNVNVTGKNAMYTRPGTLKGAKLVASTTTLNDLKDSNKGQKNWMAYQTVTTDRGSIYYKIVSFDKKYRGYVYAGSTKDNPKGGVVKFDTMKNVTETLSDSNKGNFKIAKPGTANDNKTVTYKAPAWTEMGVGRVITDSTPYANDVLTITKQGERTREGDQWVYVTDETNPAINGWILRSGLTTTTDVPASQGVTVHYIDKDTNKEVGTPVVIAVPKDVTTNITGNAADVKKVNDNKPANEGYKNVDGSMFSKNATVAKQGDDVYVYIQKADDVTMQATAAYNVQEGVSLSKSGLDGAKLLDASGKKLYLSSVKLTGAEGATVSSSDLTSKVTDAKLDTVYVKDAGNNDTYSKYTFSADKTISVVNSGSLKYKNSGFGLGYVKAAGSYKLDQTNNGMVQA